MSNLLQKHPEILRFKEDQLVLSSAIEKYIRSFKKKYSELDQNLETFRNTFSKIKTFSTHQVDDLAQLPQWTYTKAQHNFAVEQLQRIAENYPVPKQLASGIKPGEYLDLRAETNEQKFYKDLDTFAEKIQKKLSPEPIDSFDIHKIGKIPLQDFTDPLLDIDKIWTLDVSYNPGLSIKDIMAKQMIEDALLEKKLRKTQIIVEGTSGNTGAGLAIIAAHYGIRIILIIPDKMSQEKIDRLRYLGAHVIVTPTKVAADDPKSYYSVRDYMTEKTDGWSAQQYDNLSNRKAHEKITGPLIWEQTKGEVTAVIATAGTCGTISGIGEYLKKKNPKIKMIAVDTVGSILYLLKEGYNIDEVQKYSIGYTIQGFGEDIHPQNLDLEVVDKFIRVSDISGLQMARLLPALGFVAGQSSGAAYTALIESPAQDILQKKDKVVVIFPDTGVPYRQDVFNDQWMKEKNVSLHY